MKIEIGPVARGYDHKHAWVYGDSQIIGELYQEIGVMCGMAFQPHGSESMADLFRERCETYRTVGQAKKAIEEAYNAIS